MTHNVQKGGDFLKSYSANCNQVASFRERTVKKGRVHWTSTRDGKIPSKLCGWHFLLGVCLSFTNCLRTSRWKVNETRPYGLFQGKFPGATEHLKRLSCCCCCCCCFFFLTGRNVLNGNLCFISKIVSLSDFQAFQGLICVNNWPKPWTVSCPCKWQTN